MGNICRPPPPPVAGSSPDEMIPEMEEEVGMNCLMSGKLNCFHKADSFEITGSEASTPGPKTLHGYVPVTPISASSYDAIQPEVTEEEGLHMRIFDYREERAGHGESVYLHLYDLNDTFAHMNSVSLDLLGLGGALHVGVEVLGNEWSFGMQGVSITTPKQNQYYTYRQTVTMGRTGLKRKEVEGVILALKRRWTGVEYDLLDRNCGHFCNELCQALGVGRMPSWVTRVAETMALMPGSHTLKNSISRAMMEDQGHSPRWMDDEAYLVSTPPAHPGKYFRSPPGSGTTLPSTGSPVHCHYGAGSSALDHSMTLAQQRCEAFHVDSRNGKAVVDRLPMRMMSMAAHGGA